MISFLKDVWVVCLEATSEANDFQFVFILFSDFRLPRSFDGGSLKDVVFFSPSFLAPWHPVCQINAFRVLLFRNKVGSFLWLCFWITTL